MDTEMIELEVNGVAVKVPKGSNLLVAAKAANIKIPTLCYHPDLKPGASCGICVVRQLVPSRTEPGKFVPSPKLLRACCTEAMPGMKIITHDPDIVQVRRTVLELIHANLKMIIDQVVKHHGSRVNTKGVKQRNLIIPLRNVKFASYYQ